MHAQCIIQAQHTNMHAQHANMLAPFPGLPRVFVLWLCLVKRKNAKLSSAAMYYTERKPKNENEGALNANRQMKMREAWELGYL